MANFKKVSYYPGIAMLVLGVLGVSIIGFGPILLIALLGAIFILISEKSLWVRLLTVLLLPVIIIFPFRFWIFSGS